MTYQLGDAAGAWMASDPDHGEWDRRAGFRKAGALLLEQAASSPIHHQLIYPALAVYRHYYELALKELVRIVARVLLEPTTPHLKHELPSLLAYVEQGMEAVWPDDMDELTPVRESVDFLHGVDPSGQVFRYPTLSRTGVPSIPEPAFLEPDLVAEFLAAGAEILGGADIGMSVWIDQRNEAMAMQHEYDQEMQQEYDELQREYDRQIRGWNEY
jgi:hypothetical protein